MYATIWDSNARLGKNWDNLDEKFSYTCRIVRALHRQSCFLFRSPQNFFNNIISAPMEACRYSGVTQKNGKMLLIKMVHA